MPSDAAVLMTLQRLRRDLTGDVSLSALSRTSGWSRFHLHRAVQRLTGETPKQYAQRLRLERAAAALLTSGRSILDVALEAGFSSPEVFSRAFRRHFGRTASRYRDESVPVAVVARKRHAALTESIGPCIHLFHFPTCSRTIKVRATSSGTRMPMLSIVRETRPSQPFLFIRRRVARSEIAAALGECFGQVFSHCMAQGLPIAGRPTARYIVTGPGLLTLEAGVPLSTASDGVGEIEAGELSGGAVAVAMHGGVYDELPATHAAIERWIEEQGLRSAGAPWEAYITDPVEFPNPEDWRTEVCWPLE